MLFNLLRITIVLGTNLSLFSMVDLYRTKEHVITSLKTIIIKKNSPLNHISLNEFHGSPKHKIKLNLGEFNKKTLILGNFPKQKQKYEHRYINTNCMQWIGGKLIDTCKNPDGIADFLAAAAALGIATAFDKVKDNIRNGNQTKADKAVENINSTRVTKQAARDSALKKAISEGKYPHDGVQPALDNRVYSQAEVKRLRDRGVKQAILTVDADGNPYYDMVDAISSLIVVDPKTNESKPFSEYKEQKKTPQNKNGKNAGKSTAAAGGDPKDPRNGNKRDQKDKNGENRKQNTGEERGKAVQQLKGRLAIQQGQHKIYSVDASQTKALAEASGKNIGYIGADYTHNEIEAYDESGRHLGAIDPVTKKFIPGKNRVPDRDFRKP